MRGGAPRSSFGGSPSIPCLGTRRSRSLHGSLARRRIHAADRRRSADTGRLLCQDSRDASRDAGAPRPPGPLFSTPGQPRPIEGRNPLSDTTDVTSDVSNVADDATTAPTPPSAVRQRSVGDAAARAAEPGRVARHLRHRPDAQGRADRRDQGAARPTAAAGAPRPRAEVAAATTPARDEVRAEVRAATVAGGAAGARRRPRRGPTARRRDRARCRRAAPRGPERAAEPRAEAAGRAGRAEAPTARAGRAGERTERRTRACRARRPSGPSEAERGDRPSAATAPSAATVPSAATERTGRPCRAQRPAERTDAASGPSATSDRAGRPQRPGSDRAATATTAGSGAERDATATTTTTAAAGAAGAAGSGTAGGAAASGTAARDGGGGGEPQVSEDDVLVPVAGILDVLDNYAFVRTSGYLAGPNDVYVSMSQIKQYGLRRGDAVTGAVRAAARRRAAAGQVQPAGPPGHDQRDGPGGGPAPAGVLQADPAVPAGAAAAGDRAAHPHHPGHRPGHADRQGPAGADRLAAEGRQDDGAAGDRQRDRDATTPSAT